MYKPVLHQAPWISCKSSPSVNSTSSASDPRLPLLEPVRSGGNPGIGHHRSASVECISQTKSYGMLPKNTEKLWKIQNGDERFVIYLRRCQLIIVKIVLIVNGELF